MAVTIVPFMLNPDLLASGDLASVFTLTNTPTISSGNGRGGGKAIRCTLASNASVGCSVALSGLATYSISCALKISVIPTNSNNANGVTLLAFRNSSTIHTQIVINPVGQLQAINASLAIVGTASRNFPVTTQVHIEVLVTVSDTVGVIKIWQDENLVLSLSSQDTRNGATTTIDNIYFGCISNSVGTGSGATYDYSDITIADDQAGDKKNQWLQPNASGGLTDFANTGGGSNNASVADSTQDGDTSYVSSSTIGQHDSYGLPNLTGSPTVFAVGSWHVAKKTDAGTRKYKPLLRISSTNYLGTENSPGTTYGFGYNGWLVSPATATAFTASEVNGMEMGQEVSA